MTKRPRCGAAMQGRAKGKACGLSAGHKGKHRSPDSAARMAAKQAEYQRRPESREYRRKWASENPERVREAGRRFERNHRGRSTLKARMDPERHREYQRKWERTHPEDARTQRHQKNWRKAGIIGMDVGRLDALLMVTDCRCWICSRPFDDSQQSDTYRTDHDHSIDDRPNWRGLLCHKCNIGMHFIDSGWALPSPAIKRYLVRFAWMDKRRTFGPSARA